MNEQKETGLPLHVVGQKQDYGFRLSRSRAVTAVTHCHSQSTIRSGDRTLHAKCYQILCRSPAAVAYSATLDEQLPAFTDLQVAIYDQVAEGDKVTTRKAITGTHTGELFGLAPTHQQVTIDVIDIFRLQDGKLLEHWGLTSLPTVMAQLAAS